MSERVSERERGEFEREGVVDDVDETPDVKVAINVFQKKKKHSLSLPKTTVSSPTTPTAREPFLTASRAYSTWNLRCGV